MGLASTLIGVLPTYATAGVWAPVLLILLRLLQGFGAGAEQAGASVLMTEYAPRDSRGFLASLPFTGIMLGTVAAALVYFLVLARIENVAETWLWRIPFLLSVVIIAVAIWMRLSLKELPEFAKLEARKQITERPLAKFLGELQAKCSSRHRLTNGGERRILDLPDGIVTAIRACGVLSGRVAPRG